MQLDDRFSVPVPVDTVWNALLDVERVAPCMPGASVESIDGDDIRGLVRIKLGPISMQYRGTLTITERDDVNRHVVMTAKARETRGGGAVSATIASTVVPVGDGTEVQVVTDLDVTGRAAQFGRGVMVDVSRQIMGQFADNLARELTSPNSDVEAGAATQLTGHIGEHDSTSPGVARVPPPTASAADSDSLDVAALLMEPVKRALPALITGLVAGIVLGRITKRRPR